MTFMLCLQLTLQLVPPPQGQNFQSDQVCPVLVVNGVRVAVAAKEGEPTDDLGVLGQVLQCPRPVSSPPPEETHASS